MRCEYLRRLSVVIAVALGKSETYFFIIFSYYLIGSEHFFAPEKWHKKTNALLFISIPCSLGSLASK
jgi:hypothetical protein